MEKYLSVGGLISGRGVFAVGSWERVARDYELAYPEDGHAIGIGPMEGMVVPVEELDYDTELLYFVSPDRRYYFEYDQGSITISDKPILRKD